MNMKMGIASCIGKCITYYNKYENVQTKMARLDQKLASLKSREQDIIRELKYAESLSKKKRKMFVENWLTRVSEVKTQANELQQKAQLQGQIWCIHIQMQLFSAIDKLVEQATELIKVVFLDGLVFDVHENHALELPTSELIVGREFHERKKMIHEGLRTNSVFSIGIYGMGGIGKSTLITHVHNELRNDSNVRVVWVTVSQNFCVHKLQSDIAKALSLDIGNENDDKKRAAKIRQRLKMMNNVVLILDDLWDVFPLESVGIETRGGYCKLIFTTRSLEVCHQMACDLKVELLPLTVDEAWLLFKKTLGSGVIILTPRIEEIAKCLARECAGLPLAIISMAGSMMGMDDIREWRNALEAMRSQSLENLDDSQLEKVFRVLMYSYDALKDPVLKECFLYCSLFPEDWEIRRDTLIKYFVDEGFISGMRSREAEFDRGHRMLNRLVRVCLLQSRSNKYVKMHDVVRDLAFRITNQKRRFWVEAGLMFVDVAEEAKWLPSLERVSFMKSYLLDPLSSASPPRCPSLSTFLLRNCYNITGIPNSFFEHMTSLATLDLSITGITSLPISVSHLTSLKSLLLGSCHALVHVPPLSNLKALKRLDLSFTGIKELPQGMDMLSNLRDLNLDGAKSLQMIPQGVFSKLSRLQCLALPKLAIGKAVVEEIVSLRKLETFKGEFYSTNGLETLLKSWKEVRPYEYILGPYDKDSSKLDGFEKYVSIKNYHDLGSLCDIKSLRNLSDLRTCCVEESHQMKHLFCQICYNYPFVQSLEILHLRSLFNLQHLLCEGSCAPPSASSSSSPSLSPPPSSSSLSPSSSSSSSSSSLTSTSTLRFWASETFSSLKEFRMCKCPAMKKLFAPTLLSQLANLETLEICDCDKLLEIVQGPLDPEASTSGYTDLRSTLRKLKSLKLSRLPDLKSFFRHTNMVSSSLEQVIIVDCPKLETIPFLGGESYHLASGSTFSTVKEVTIKGCHEINKLFTLAMPSRLENLEKLFVLDCKELTEVVHVYEDVDDQYANERPISNNNITFCALPKLKVLKMENLPKVKSLCRSRKIVSDSIEEISIFNCPKLQGLFPLVREEPNALKLLKSITVEDEWWESTEFEHAKTKEVLKSICDFRRRSVRPCLLPLITYGEVPTE